LYDKDIVTPNIVNKLDPDFTIAKIPNLSIPERYVRSLANPFRDRSVGAA
jgi:hypothetical protein